MCIRDRYYILKNQDKKIEINSLKLVLNQQDNKFDALGISGYLKDSTLIHLTIRSHINPEAIERVIEKELYFVNLPQKQFFTEILVDCTAYKYSVNMEWPDTLSSGFSAMRIEIDHEGKIIESTTQKTKKNNIDTIPQNPALAEKLRELIDSSKRN